MSDKTGIEWTDATWNPVTGCTKLSQGCKNCYAKHQAWPRLSAMPNTVYTGREFEDVMCHPERLDQPLCWTKPRLIFVNSMSDLFHEDVPFEFIASVFWVMSVTTRHTYQVLTKRPQRMLEFFKWVDEGAGAFPDDRISDCAPDEIAWKPATGSRSGYDNCGPAFPYENVWLGVSVEDQDSADERIPLLLQAPAAVRWISAEPLLGGVNLERVELNGGRFDALRGGPVSAADWPGINWVVVGGESGANARPMHVDWARSIRDQCAAANVPFLFKQWGEWAPYDRSRVDGEALATPCSLDVPMQRVGKKSAGRLLDGVQHDGYPKGGPT